MAGKNPTITTGLTFDTETAQRQAKDFVAFVRDLFEKELKGLLATATRNLYSPSAEALRKANPEAVLTTKVVTDDGAVTATLRRPSLVQELKQNLAHQKREEADLDRQVKAEQTALSRADLAAQKASIRAFKDAMYAQKRDEKIEDKRIKEEFRQNDLAERERIQAFKDAMYAQKRDEKIEDKRIKEEFRQNDLAEKETRRHGKWVRAGKTYTAGGLEDVLNRAGAAGLDIPPLLQAAHAEAVDRSSKGDADGAQATVDRVRKEAAELEAATAAQVKKNLEESRKLAAQEKREEKFGRYGLIYGSRTLISGIGGRVGDLLTGDPWANSMGGQSTLGMMGDASKALSNFSAKSILANGPGVLNVAGLIGGAIGSEVLDVMSKLAARGAGIAKYATGVQSDWMMNYGMLTGAGPTQYDQIMGNALPGIARGLGRGGTHGYGWMSRSRGIRPSRGEDDDILVSGLKALGFDSHLGGLANQVQWKRQREDLFGKMRAFANDTAGNADEALGRIAGASQGARLSASDIGDAFTVLRRQGIASGGKGVGSMLAMRAFGAGGNVDAAASILNRAAGGFNLGPGGLEGLQQMSANLTGSLLGLGASGDVTMQSANAFGGLSAAGVSMQRVPGVTQSYLSDIAGARGMLGGNSFGKLRQSAIMLAALKRAGGDPMKAASEVANVSMDEQRSTALSTFGSELSTTAFAMGGMSRGEAERYAGGQGQLQGEEVKLPPASWYDRLQSAINNANNVTNGAKNLGEIGGLERTNAILNSIAINLNNIVSGLGAGMFFGGGS